MDLPGVQLFSSLLFLAIGPSIQALNREANLPALNTSEQHQEGHCQTLPRAQTLLLRAEKGKEM